MLLFLLIRNLIKTTIVPFARKVSKKVSQYKNSIVTVLEDSITLIVLANGLIEPLLAQHVEATKDLKHLNLFFKNYLK